MSARHLIKRLDKEKLLWIPALIGYYSGDEYGSDGWWEEGASSHEIRLKAVDTAAAAGFGSVPEFVEVDPLKLDQLDEEAWDDFYAQWRLSRNNGWTSDAVDTLVKREMAQRGVD